MAKIWIKSPQKRMRIDPHLIRRTAKGILAQESALTNPEVSILLLEDERIAELNAEYLKRSGPTDVISFPMHDGSFPDVQPELLGDVAVSVETAERQARRREVGLHEEMTRLLIHGILHLLGYDHESSAQEARRMRAREKEIFKTLMEDEKIRAAVENPA